MRNWSIQRRLLAGFGGLTCLLLLLGIYAIQGLNTLAAQTRNLYEHPMAVTNAILSVDASMVRMQQSIQQVASTPGVATVTAQAAAITRHANEAERQLKIVQSAFLGPPSMVQAILQSTAQWTPLRAHVLELAKAQKYDSAMDLALSQSNAKVAEINRATSALKTWAEKKGTAFYNTANDVQKRTILSFSIALLLAALIAISVALYIANTIRKPLVHALQLANAVSNGDLTSPPTATFNDEIGQLLRTMYTMQSSLAEVANGVRRASDNVAAASAEIAQGNLDLSQRTDEQASALTETASNAKQLSDNVTDNAQRARTANKWATDASVIALKGGQVVTQVVQTMRGINDASKRIADIIGVIDGIAFQTNILALNAAVEAARAGEQGRGFAVVASEVRSLAGRSAGAAKEIKLLINASVERVAHGTQLVDQAGTTMTEVVTSIQRVTVIMGEISAASDAQREGMTKIDDAVHEMDHVTQQNAALVEEMAASAGSLKGQVRDLVQVVAVFKTNAS